LQEGQAYAKLHALDTDHAAMGEGLLWAALAAAARTRFLAPMPHLLAGVSRSTRQGARGALHVVGNMGRALQTGDEAGLDVALEEAITSLACQAQRAHPKRDRQTGRSQRGLEPLLAGQDVTEFEEAA
jgi:hypothetical protein